MVSILILVCGWTNNPEKYSSSWESSPNRDEHLKNIWKYLKPPPSITNNVTLTHKLQECFSSKQSHSLFKATKHISSKNSLPSTNSELSIVARCKQVPEANHESTNPHVDAFGSGIMYSSIVLNIIHPSTSKLSTFGGLAGATRFMVTTFNHRNFLGWIWLGALFSKTWTESRELAKAFQLPILLILGCSMVSEKNSNWNGSWAPNYLKFTLFFGKQVVYPLKV